MAILKKIPVLAIVAIIVIIISGILQMIALATPYWHMIYARNQGRIGHAGLWHGCQQTMLTIYCSNPNYLPAWLIAVRILEVVGVMFMSGALTMMVVFIVVQSERWSNMTRNSATVSALIAGLLSLIGAIIYGISIKNNKEVLFLPRTHLLSFLTIYYNQFSWGFGLSVSAAILCVISGILIGFAKKKQVQ